jgi:hypothetical protein
MKFLGPFIFFLALAMLGLLSPTPPKVKRAVVEAAPPPPATQQTMLRPATVPVVVRGQPGFYRLTQDSTGAWWFMSPGGQREFLCSVATVQPVTESEANDPNAWAQTTLKKLREIGFNAIGPGSHPIFHLLNIPTFRDLNIWTGPANSQRRFYDPDFAATAEQTIKSQVELLASNTNLVGYFLDDNLDFTADTFSPAHYFNQLAADDPNRLEVMKVVQATWYSPASFNADWNTTIKEFAELNGWNALPTWPAQASARLRSAWMAHLAHDYFSFAAGRVRSYDANHLIFGIRCNAVALFEVARASREFVDAQAVNLYSADARCERGTFAKLYEQTRQPVLIGEYSFHSLDNRSNAQNLANLPGQVPDQQARAEGYRLFTTRLARLPFVIGADWFQYADSADANVGIVDSAGNPYELLTASIHRTAGQLAQLHTDSASDLASDVFRETPAAKPIMTVPQSESKLLGLRRFANVGAERFAEQPADVRIAWSGAGMNFKFEISNSAPMPGSIGNWQAADRIEIFLSTRPTGSDQEAYTPYCHHFVVLPQSTPVAGQIHHAGDALGESLWPNPEVKVSEKIVKERAVLEVEIPSKALNGFDPIGQPAIAFDVLVHEQAHAIDYYWAAAPPAEPSLHPREWGTIYLKGAGAKVASTTQATTGKPEARATN